MSLEQHNGYVYKYYVYTHIDRYTVYDFLNSSGVEAFIYTRNTTYDYTIDE